MRTAKRPMLHRSKLASLGGFCCILGGCSAKDVTVPRAIVVSVPSSCGDAGGATVTFTGLGDFETLSSPSETATLGSSGFSLSALPPASRAVTITPLGDGGGWVGAALVPDAGPIPILALPATTACPFTNAVGSLGGTFGATLGLIDATHALAVGGLEHPWVVDLSTGTVDAGLTLNYPRNYATITPFGTGALVAGGEDPMNGEPYQSAEVYPPNDGGIINLIDLNRTEHGAAALLDGATLLAGGADGTNALDTMELVTPGMTKSQSVDAKLSTGRVLPAVLALPNGDVFVGGGFTVEGKPLASADWFAPDLTAMERGQPLCMSGKAQGFAPTEGGAVLAVFSGAAPPGCSNVMLLRPGAAQLAPALPALKKVALFEGAKASPLLISDQGVFRWNPWTAVFTPLGSFGVTTPLTPAILSVGRGLALWIDESNAVWALRFDTRGPYDTDFFYKTLLSGGDFDTAPDVLPDAGAKFAPGEGLTLAPGVTLFVTDTTYADVTISFTLKSPGSATVLLRTPSGASVTCSVHGSSPSVVRVGSQVTGCSAAPALSATDRIAVGFQGPLQMADLTVLRAP